MPEKNKPFRVITQSVVLVAQHHSPSIVTPDFLRKTKIIQQHWQEQEPLIISPVVAQMSFEKIRWMVTPDRCVVEEPMKGAFSDANVSYECAKKYAKTLSHIPYTAIGLNWIIAIRSDINSEKWMKSRFLKDGPWQDESVSLASMTIRFKSEDGYICTLATNIDIPVSIPADIPKERQVIVACNFHFDLQGKADAVQKITSILENGEKHQTVLNKYLHKYFIEKN